MSLPVPTFINDLLSDATGITQKATFDLGSSTAAADIFVVVGISLTAGVFTSSVTLTPSAGSPITATAVDNSLNLSMYRLLVPSGTTGINAAELSVTYSGDPSTRSIFSMWTVPAADLSSQTPVDHDATFDASTTATSLTLDISTSLGGFYIAISYAQVSTSYTWSGDEGTLTERFDTFQAGATHSGADANNTAAATNTNTITATFGAGGLDELVAGSWGASSSPPPPPTFNPGWVNRATSGVAGSGVF